MYHNQHLSDMLIKSLAPSCFANEPAPGASDRYQFVRTIDVVNTMREVGYEVVKASQGVARNPAGQQYTKHCLRLQHRDFLAGDRREVGDVVPQILLSNSHDRTSAFQLDAGLFRLWCANGMAVSIAGMASYRVLHNDKNIHDHIIDGANLVREVIGAKVLPQIDGMMKKELTAVEEKEFALAATFLKYGEVKPAEVEFFLQLKRDEDAGRSLWSVLNRCQEAAVRGGYETTDAAGRRLVRKGIATPGRDLDFNMALWSLGAAVLEG